jgi:hypothetical protein
MVIELPPTGRNRTDDVHDSAVVRAHVTEMATPTATMPMSDQRRRMTAFTTAMSRIGGTSSAYSGSGCSAWVTG